MNEERNYTEEELAEAEALIEDAMEGIIYLSDDNDDDVPFRYLDDVEYEGKNYAVLLPLDEEDEGFVILEVVEDESEDYATFNGVEDEDVLEAVFEIFKERMEAEFDGEE